VVIFFEEDISDRHVKNAMLAARLLRRALKDFEGAKRAEKSARTYGRTST
jgi:hypothetical protein